MNVNTLLATLPQLSKADLLQVKARVNILLEGKTETQHDNDTERYLVQEIAAVLEERGLGWVPVSRLKESLAITDLRKAIPQIESFLADIRDKHYRRKLIRIGVMLLFDQLAEWEIAVSGVTLMRNAHRIPGVINKHFPGYAHNKILALLVERR